MRSHIDLPYKFLGIAVLSAVLAVFLAVFSNAEGPKGKALEKIERLEAVRQGERNASPQEIKNLKAGADPLTRARANQALVSVEGSSAVAELLGDLQNDPSDLVRQTAAESLGNYARESRVAAALVFALRNDDSSTVRIAAARSVGLADPVVAITALESVQNHSNPLLRRQVASSLARFDNDNRAKKALKKMRRDSDEFVREIAK